MKEYIKLFNNHNAYTAFILTADFVKPNVSLCVNESEVHYNPIETRVVCKFNVTKTSSATNIMASSTTSQFSEIEIDGVVLSSVVAEYQFNTLGEHTVKYMLSDPTSIGTNAFQNCSGLTSVTIPNSVTSIGESAFYNCTGLTSITIESTTPPTVSTSVFNNTNNCPIYVPSASIETYKAATGWSSYASRIQAIPSN